MLKGNMPDITAAQIIAVVGSLIGVIVAFGVDLSAVQQDAIMDVVKIVAPVLIAGDAVIRTGRNYRAARVGQPLPTSEPTAQQTRVRP
jgi:prolipoprotein diacylglyceryltransferase